MWNPEYCSFGIAGVCHGWSLCPREPLWLLDLWVYLPQEGVANASQSPGEGWMVWWKELFVNKAEFPFSNNGLFLFGGSISNTLKAYIMHFWMSCYNHPTPKRTSIVSNSPQIGHLATPKRNVFNPKGIKTTRRYKDAKGKDRWQGTKELKGTQKLSSKEWQYNVVSIQVQRCQFTESSIITSMII